MRTTSPHGQFTNQGSRRRARQSPEHRAEFARLEPYEEVARQVIQLRMDHHLSQEALARRVGTTKSAISRLESGHHAPTVATLHRVASAFGRQLVISFGVPATPVSRRRATGRATPPARTA